MLDSMLRVKYSRHTWARSTKIRSLRQKKGGQMRSISLAISISLALAVYGQSDRGTITGTISDPAGAVVASAPIQARNVATGALYDAASTDTGNYTLSQLPAGAYEVAV